MSLRLIACACLVICTSAALADQDSKWYVGAAVGSNSVKDFSIDRRTGVGAVLLPVTKLDVDMKSDTSFSAIVGYRFTDEWSLQGEWSHRSNKSDSVKTANGSRLPQNDVRLRSDALMANAIYTVRGLGAVRPYAGIGVGAARLRMDKDDSLGGSDDSTWAFAYQGFLGAEVSLSRQWIAYGQYQYFTTSQPNLKPTSVLGTSSQHYVLDSYPASQTLSIGVRYNF